MSGLIRFSMVVVMSAGLVACGGGAGKKLAAGKENAAAALFQAAAPASKAKGALAVALKNGLTAGGETSISCTKGGKATVTYDIDVGDVQNPDPEQSSDLSMTMKYEDCSEGENTKMNGSLEITMHTEVDATNPEAPSGSISMIMKGKVTFTGDIADFIEVDVTEYVDFAELSATSGEVTVALEGTITTSTETYTFSQADEISFTAGKLEGASDTKTDG